MDRRPGWTFTPASLQAPWIAIISFLFIWLKSSGQPAKVVPAAGEFATEVPDRACNRGIAAYY
jgi:hypothetical protein